MKRLALAMMALSVIGSLMVAYHILTMDCVNVIRDQTGPESWLKGSCSGDDLEIEGNTFHIDRIEPGESVTLGMRYNYKHDRMEISNGFPERPEEHMPAEARPIYHMKLQQWKRREDAFLSAWDAYHEGQRVH